MRNGRVFTNLGVGVNGGHLDLNQDRGRFMCYLGRGDWKACLHGTVVNVRQSNE